LNMLKISFEALEMLDAIDRLGSFARAANALGKVPSALTYSVRKLEDDLDTLIFDRRGYRATLTPAGKLLLEQGRLLLDRASQLQAEIAQTAKGWELELRIALDAILPWSWLQPHIDAYYREACPARLRITEETLVGAWDALTDDRATLVIGASGDIPNSAQFSSQPLFDVQFTYCVSPKHALARAQEPIASADVSRFRAIAVADTSRSLPHRTTGVLSGQDRLIVPSMQAKIDAQVGGLGGGYLATWFAKPYLKSKQLIEKKVDAPKPRANLVLAWRSSSCGKALNWWRRRLEDAKPPR
jgi:DNA-binding transcriptional LysR family regulator